LDILMSSIPSYADDTDVFESGIVSVPPNVLIIFDSSGTMNDPINQTPYYPEQSYAAKLTAIGKGNFAVSDDLIYYISGYTGGGHERPVYSTFPPPVSKKSGAQTPLNWRTATNYCEAARTGITTKGWWMGNIEIAPSTVGGVNPYYACGGDAYKLYAGNYINFMKWLDYGADGTVPASKPKVEIAYETVANLVRNIDDDIMRFGLMIYNRNQQGQGGEIIAPVGSTDDEIIAAMENEILARKSQLVSATPLAECLAEAGLYFAGKEKWSSNLENVPPHVSPVQYRCQKNYVILMTDGQSTDDQGVNNRAQDIFLNKDKNGHSMPQYFGKAIGDYDNDGVDPATDAYGGTHYLDDVARFLWKEDLIKGGTDDAGQSFDSLTFPIQNIVTFAVGFGTGTDFTFLDRVVDTDHGQGGKNFGNKALVAEDGAKLADAFDKFTNEILVANSSFVAPVVPVNKLNKVYSGNSVYLSLFKPSQTDPFWKGNLKKFGIDSYGRLLDKNLVVATDPISGQILDTADSCWVTGDTNDGSETDKGGAGQVLLDQATRHFYFNKDDASSCSLTASNNAFTAANTGLSQTLVDFLTASGDYARNGSLARDWVLGDLLHSKPVTMFDGDKTIIFVGSNDGFLHALVDDNKGSEDILSNDTLTEAWAFAPWEIVSRLHLLMDGSPVLYDVRDPNQPGNRYLTFGLRRGGSGYYTLDVGDVSSTGEYVSNGYMTPSLAWKIDDKTLTSETLGQSWGKPVVSTIKTGSTSTAKVLILPGGYDDVSEDPQTPAATDSKGRAIYAVYASNGGLYSNLAFTNSLFSSLLKHCFVELTAFDSNNDGFTDTIYAGDMGGNLFGANDRDGNGNWMEANSFRKIFQARHVDAGTQNMLLKFFYEPDVGVENFGNYIFIGTGDREHPSSTSAIDRFYAIKHKDWNSSTVLNETNLVNVTSYDYSATTLTSLDTGNGWFIKLDERSGEKVASSPLLYNGIVFFTTYVPESAASTPTDDPCFLGIGGGRLYALDYRTGKAAMNFNTANDTAGVVLDKSDRSTSLGVGIPSPPTLIVTKDGGAMLIIGTSGPTGTTGAKTFTIPTTGKARMYYWKHY